MNKQKVVIYCRVSSDRQVREGNGLDSQESKCRTWCNNKGYEVIKVFKEEGISGGKEDRPALKEMFRYLSDLKEPCIVLVEDLNRWARDTFVHNLLKSQLKHMGHSLQSVNMTLEDSAEGALVENIFATLSQFFRQSNARRAKSCMVEHIKNGFWIFCAPIGYKHEKINGKIHCVRSEPTATYIQEALEGFATGKFLTNKSVLDYLKDKDLVNSYGRHINITFNHIKTMLSNKVYTGIFGYPHWNIPEQKWAIEPIISLETYQKIQDRLHGKCPLAKPRKYNIHDEDFPLRRWVKCPVCGHALTGSKPRSKSGKHHPYYHCYYKKCSQVGKTIRPSELHQDFEKLLADITPKKSLIDLAQVLIVEKCENVSKDWHEHRIKMQKELATLKQEKERCFSLLLEQGNNQTVSDMCKTKLAQIDARITEIENTTHEDDIKQAEALKAHSKYVLDFLRQPLAVWKIGDYRQKQGVLKLCFTEPISYNKAQKFGTPNLSPIFGLFHHFDANTNKWWTGRDSNP